MLPLKKFSFLSIVIFGVTLLQAAALNSPAPKFALMNQHKQRRALPDFKGKVVFINFWASWCGPCQEELPELDRLAGDYSGKKVKVLAINVDQNRSEARKLLARLGLTSSRIEVLWDTQSKVVGTYNIENMPSSFILDQQGFIRHMHAGFHSQDPPAWRQEIDHLLGNKG